MNNWNYKKLSTLCSRIGDGLHGTPEYSKTSDIYFINGNNLNSGKIEINDNTKKVSLIELENNFIQLNENSLLLSINGTIGSMAFYNNEKVMLGKSAAYLNFNSGINKFYYYYFQLEQIQKYFYNVATGSTIKNLSLKSIQDFEVPVPDKVEWQKIASVLSSLDSKIELNNRINAELEAMAKTLYDYWFVQFDFPDTKGKPYKTSGGKMVWNDELKREIPEGWAKIKMIELYEFQYGFGNTNPDNGGKYPVYGSNGIIGGYDKFNNEDAPVIGHIGNNCGSLVFADGKHYVTYNGVMCKIRNGYNKYFGYAVLKSKDLKSNTRGSSQPFISYDMLNSLDVIIPEPKLMKIYCELANPLFDKVIINNKENQQLTELRDWLLPMLMNGQVKVEDVEEELSMAAEPVVGYGKK